VRKIYLSSRLSFVYLFFFEQVHANITCSDIVSSRWSIRREINRQANDIRQHLGLQLKKAVSVGVLAISPDLWSDKFKQNSYLELTAHFVDDHHVLHSIDLCCEPYNEVDKCAPSVRQVGNNAKSNLFSLFRLLGDYFCSLGLESMI
jgi:hypothetical protein